MSSWTDETMLQVLGPQNRPWAQDRWLLVVSAILSLTVHCKQLWSPWELRLQDKCPRTATGSTVLFTPGCPWITRFLANSWPLPLSWYSMNQIFCLIGLRVQLMSKNKSIWISCEWSIYIVCWCTIPQCWAFIRACTVISFCGAHRQQSIFQSSHSALSHASHADLPHPLHFSLALGLATYSLSVTRTFTLEK